MNSSVALGLLLAGSAACASGCAVNEVTVGVPVQKEQLVNKRWELWSNEDQSNSVMPSLVFSDSTVIGHSRGDTVFRFTYELKGRYLLLKDFKGRVEKSRILHIGPTTFTVDKLWFLEGKQTYHREVFGP
jgi:hypothetical protein